MNNSSITSYYEFENFCKINFTNKSSTENKYILSIGASFQDIKRILDLSSRAFSADKKHSDFISKIIFHFNIEINKIDDFEYIVDVFSKVHKNLKRNIKLIFNVNITSQENIKLLFYLQNNVYPYFNDISLKTTTYIEFDRTVTSDYVTCFYNNIRHNKDINDFIDNYTNDKRDELKLSYRDNFFVFNIDLQTENNFDSTILHKYILICCKYKNFCKGFIINITGGDTYRIKSFVSTILCDKIIVVSNRVLLTKEFNKVGRLPPAIYIESYNDLLFLQNPLNKTFWDKIAPRIKDTNRKKSFYIEPINSKTNFNSNINTERFWPYLRLCQKYLFEDFDYNKSKSYTFLRRIAYSSEFFYDEYVSKIPFLALFVFAIYDNFYRSNLLLKFKNDCGKKNYILDFKDFLPSRQSKQNHSIFKAYIETKNDYDIKNLLIDCDEENFTNIKLHKTITAEIFECISISEGLLQILENALLHAQSGLLSLRVYSRAKGLETQKSIKENHVEYLNSVYSENYFNYKKTDFYLEVQISDLSEKSISKTFSDNLDKNLTIQDKLFNQYNWSKSSFNAIKENIDLQFFFSANSRFKDSHIDEIIDEFKRVFYEIDENLVHHYGLETFNSILSSRDGVFSVCGHGNKYDNLEHIFNKIYSKAENSLKNNQHNIDNITANYNSVLLKTLLHNKNQEIAKIRDNISTNISISGTTYRILFPLNHSSINEPTVNTSTAENISYTSQPFKLILIDKFQEFKKIDTIKTKQNNINEFFNDIKSVFRPNVEKENIKVLCIDMHYINNQTPPIFNEHFEEIIKGILLFGLKELRENTSCTVLPIAIVNLTPFQLIEASRIISIYYKKNCSKNDDSVFENMPIYLKCERSSKEVLFAGTNLTEVKNTILKTVMKNGTMYDDLNTIIRILEKNF